MNPMNHKQNALSYWPNAYHDPHLMGHRIVIPWPTGEVGVMQVGHGRSERAAWRSASRHADRERKRRA